MTDLFFKINIIFGGVEIYSGYYNDHGDSRILFYQLMKLYRLYGVRLNSRQWSLYGTYIDRYHIKAGEKIITVGDYDHPDNPSQVRRALFILANGLRKPFYTFQKFMIINEKKIPPHIMRLIFIYSMQ